KFRFAVGVVEPVDENTAVLLDDDPFFDVEDEWEIPLQRLKHAADVPLYLGCLKNLMKTPRTQTYDEMMVESWDEVGDNVVVTTLEMKDRLILLYYIGMLLDQQG
ncbi:9171_t:CDS:2, partial [Acaulospora colombiana]